MLRVSLTVLICEAAAADAAALLHTSDARGAIATHAAAALDVATLALTHAEGVCAVPIALEGHGRENVQCREDRA